MKHDRLEVVTRLQLAASIPLLLANWVHADLYVNGNNPIAAVPCKRLNWTIVSIIILIEVMHVNTVHGDTSGMPADRQANKVSGAVSNLKPRSGISSGSPLTFDTRTQ